MAGVRYRERVAIHASTRSEGPRGGVIDAFTVVVGLESVPATITSRGSGSGVQGGAMRNDVAGMSIVEELYSAILAGDLPQITPEMRVVAARGTFDVIAREPTIGRRQTLLTIRATHPSGLPK